MVTAFAKYRNWRVLFSPSSVSEYHMKFLGNENKKLCIMQMDEMFTSFQ